jgi:hypothetical protein
MPSYNVSVPHSLGQEAARKHVERFLDSVQRDYAEHLSDVYGEWTGSQLNFRFFVRGLTISGALVVEETLVAVSGPLPLAAALFRGQIERTIRDELSRLLS